jgi:hypothetical protein
MNGTDLLNITDKGQLEKILKAIILEFVAAKYCNIPDTKTLYAKMGDLVGSFGYGDVDINEIAKEAAEILGMKMRK